MFRTGSLAEGPPDPRLPEIEILLQLRKGEARVVYVGLRATYRLRHVIATDLKQKRTRLDPPATVGVDVKPTLGYGPLQ